MYYCYPCITYVLPNYPAYQKMFGNFNKYNTYRYQSFDVRAVYIPNASSLRYQDAPVHLEVVKAERSPNFRKRCGCEVIGPCSSESHGQSYANIYYEGSKYLYQVRINHYGIEYYGAPDTFEEMWDIFNRAPLSYNLLTTPLLSGNGGGYFQSGNNNTPGRHTGALGLEVFDKSTRESIYKALWFFDQGWGDWGDQWLRCGQSYTFVFKER
ncbi:hypothetical protein ACL6ER_12510 [Bacillus inaquosorum]|uniref:hypothetical protein n=1 Tax=Bacillus inaquosorum TaxID=483913 RepID=UPI0039A44B0D